MTRIDDMLAVDLDRVDGAEGVEDDPAGAIEVQPEHPLAGEQLLEALPAEIDLDSLNPEFLSACFGPGEMRAAAYLQAELFADLAIALLKPMRSGFRSRRSLFWYVRPAIRLEDGTEIRIFTLGSRRMFSVLTASVAVRK